MEVRPVCKPEEKIPARLERRARARMRVGGWRAIPGQG